MDFKKLSILNLIFLFIPRSITLTSWGYSIQWVLSSYYSPWTDGGYSPFPGYNKPVFTSIIDSFINYAQYITNGQIINILSILPNILLSTLNSVGFFIILLGSILLYKNILFLGIRLFKIGLIFYIISYLYLVYNMIQTFRGILFPLTLSIPIGLIPLIILFFMSSKIVKKLSLEEPPHVEDN